MEYQKNYRLNNPEKKKECDKKYYEKSKNKFAENFLCVCGSNICFYSRFLHIKSKKHQAFLNSNV